MGRRGSQVFTTRARSLSVGRPYKRTLVRRNAFVPGRTRTGGYYGRYPPINPGGELKFYDLDLIDVIIATGGNITDSINKIPQGVTESTRVGRKCIIKNIFWRYRVYLPEVDVAATPAVDDTVRIILYMDKQCNGATAATTDILESAGVHSFRNLANSDRFSVLYDKVIAMNYNTLAGATGSVASNSVVKEFTMFKKCNAPLEFSGTDGAIGEIRSNNFGVLLVGSRGQAGFQSKLRLRFSDN